MTTYWAHSDPDGLSPEAAGSRWQLLADHLRQVGSLAELLACSARPDDGAFHCAARVAGLFHDLGKYSDGFQRRLFGAKERCPHAIHGAAIAWDRGRAADVAFAIAGHHAGLPDLSSAKTAFQKNLADAKTVWERAVQDSPDVSNCALARPEGQLDLRTRMLFSCLVDADRLDTARRSLHQPLDAAALLPKLLRFIERRAASVREGVVKDVRRRVLEACLTAALFPENLLTLTVPTGGAKTLASLAFALQRAALHPEKARRVIVVIPYLSIIEQNAQVFEDALGDDMILEHHSGNFGDDSDEDRPLWRRNATENWDAPIVVTTSVRFFESLFSNRPSDLRRLHNVARSVVILDEVQTLPRNFLEPIRSVMDEMAKDWNTTFLFCTATQPAWHGAREIMERPAEMFQQMSRVSVEWRLAHPTPWPDLAREMSSAGQVLCIVNIRDHAAQLYRELRGLSGDAVFHLSTRMCAAHRLRVIAEVRSRMVAGRPCLVVSTQLIEAGVDLDFPTVYRALGPLDSIVQAAGRCDREGRLTEQLGRPGGHLVVFATEDGRTPPHAYREATDLTATMARPAGFSIDDPNIMRRFFERYCGEGANLGEDLEELRKRLEFEKVAEQFYMIADNSRDIFVPYDDAARDTIGQLRAMGVLTGELRRRLQRYVVGLRPEEFRKALGGAIFEARSGSELWICADGFYQDDLGMTLEAPAGEMVI